MIVNLMLMLTVIALCGLAWILLCVVVAISVQLTVWINEVITVADMGDVLHPEEKK